ncbi:MAG: hypothetical protein GF350_00835 [Chitinivibrionales bacterium]|nr:hypothetical protein [Chitinivibrionales bacterium]
MISCNFGKNRRVFLKKCTIFAGACAACSCSIPVPFMKRKEIPLFSFVFCNDIHVSTRAQAEYFGATVEHWRRINTDFDFVVICGDLVNNGTSEELLHVKHELRKLGKPCYVVAGNHDLVDGVSIADSPFKEVFPSWRPNYLFQNDGFMMIVLDLTNSTNATVAVPGETVAWLRRINTRIKPDDKIIVFSHFSLHPDIPRFPVRNTAELFDILDTRQVIAFFSGHYHARWHGIRNGADYFNNACMSLAADNHDGTQAEGYLLVDVFSNRVETTFVEQTEESAVED